MLLRHLMGIALLLSISGWSEEKTPAAPDTVNIILLHVNDVHGHLEPRVKNGKATGGYARLSTLVEQVRAESKAERVFLIHAGDEFSRGDELTTRSKGAANIAIMNHLKFSLWTPGNGEFYDGVPALQDRFRQAHFPSLTANVEVTATGKILGQPYVIEEAGPVKVAFFGLCFIHTQLLPPNELKVDTPAATAKNLVPELRKQADLVIAVTHIGVDEDRKLAAEVEGLDVIIGGHSHTVLKEGERIKNPAGREVLLCQAGEYLNFVGQVDLKLARQAGKWQMVESAARLIPLDDKLKLDAAVTGLIARQAEELAQPKEAAPEEPAAAPR